MDYIFQVEVSSNSMGQYTASTYKPFGGGGPLLESQPYKKKQTCRDVQRHMQGCMKLKFDPEKKKRKKKRYMLNLQEISHSMFWV